MSYPVLTTAELVRCVERLPRVRLAQLPTALEETPRFAKAIGAGRVFIKRDDCTGLLFGGNKTRHLEFVMADALRDGCDMFVWGAGLQSNNCRQTAAACAKLGLECRLYLDRAGRTTIDVQGNLLLDHLVGAKVEIVDAGIGTALDELLLAKAAEFRAAGRRPYVWDRARVQPIAAVSYALVLAEIVDEMNRLGLRLDTVYVSSAGSTGSGLVLGKVVLGHSVAIRSICPIRWPWDVRADMTDIVNQAAALLDLPQRVGPEAIDATEEFVGPAYGKITAEGREALDLLARTEGILLDTSYTAKAMAGLIADVRSGRIARDATIVFVHTGGLPAVFAYRDEIMQSTASRE